MMPPRNDNINYIQWNTGSGEVIGTVKSVTTSSDGVTITVDATDFIKKEEDMIKNKLLKDVDRIIIDKSYDGKTVTAVAQKSNTEKGSPFFPCMIDVAKASATCGPNDIFDFNIGAKLALDRLYEGYDMTPKPKRKPYNGKIFIRCGRECCVLKNNKIYNVWNGCIVNNAGDRVASCTEPYIFEGMCEDELSDNVDINVFYGTSYKGDEKRRHYTAYFVKE